MRSVLPSALPIAASLAAAAAVAHHTTDEAALGEAKIVILRDVHARGDAAALDRVLLVGFERVERCKPARCP